MSLRLHTTLAATALLLPALAIAAPPVKKPVAVDFNKDVRPILAANCFACHGQDSTARQAGLRLDLREEAVRKAIVAGKPESSPLVVRIRSRDALQMPPPSSGHTLKEEQKRLLTEWVRQGAPYAQHWSYAPVRLPPPPAVKAKQWVRNPIDAFVLAKLEKAGLSPAPEADRYTVLRRVSLDLTGLPPTVAEADAFARDKSPDAYEKAVDRLLASPRYGEHWGRMWLDLARYADSQGYEKDQARTIWRYRDWVIDAYNRDLPYDQFTIEQLAGDLLPNPTQSQFLATAFNRNTMTNTEGGTDPEEFRVAAVKDRIDTTVQVWMGLTMGCAKCHTHKYDPITHADYYRFYALFNQTEDNNRGDEFPTSQIPTEEQARHIADLEQKLKSLRDAKAPEPQIKAAQDALAAAQKDVPRTPVMRDLAADKRRVTKIHTRGNFLTPGDVVQPAVLEPFGSLPADTPLNRLGAARWIVSQQNPLTPRVAVNRFWARIFGTGIVETEEDFGTQGTPPTHPELLDWLSYTFREGVGRSALGIGKASPNAQPLTPNASPWSQKAILKLIVTSATYRQSSAPTPTKLAKDPRNLLLSRGPRFRLTAEVIRDQALAVSGLLSAKMNGPSVMPPQPDGIWKTVYSGLKWQTSAGEDRYRRALYTFWRRTSPYPSLMTFDAGSGEFCVIRRVRTNTPLQALVTLNDPAFVEAAGALATAMLKEPLPGPKERLAYGARRVLLRPVAAAEIARLNRLYETALADFRLRPEAAKSLLKAANAKGSPEGAEAEQAACTVVANVLLNLDETVSKP